MRNLMIILLGVMCMGATMHTTKGGKFEVNLEILSPDELKSKNVISGDINLGETSYLYGWIRLEEFPKNVWSYIPSCRLIVQNSQIKVDTKIFGIGDEKQYVLIPLGKTVSEKKFKVQVL